MVHRRRGHHIDVQSNEHHRRGQSEDVASRQRARLRLSERPQRKNAEVRGHTCCLRDAYQRN